MEPLYTTSQVAEMTGRSRISVQKLAERHAGLGQKIGRDRVFTLADVERIRSMPSRPGPKPKPKAPKPPAKMGRPRKNEAQQ